MTAAGRTARRLLPWLLVGVIVWIIFVGVTCAVDVVEEMIWEREEQESIQRIRQKRKDKRERQKEIRERRR